MAQTRASPTAWAFAIASELPPPTDHTGYALWTRYIVAVPGCRTISGSTVICDRVVGSGDIGARRILRGGLRKRGWGEIIHGGRDRQW